MSRLSLGIRAAQALRGLFLRGAGRAGTAARRAARTGNRAARRAENLRDFQRDFDTLLRTGGAGRAGRAASRALRLRRLRRAVTGRGGAAWSFSNVLTGLGVFVASDLLLSATVDSVGLLAEVFEDTAEVPADIRRELTSILSGETNFDLADFPNLSQTAAFVAATAMTLGLEGVAYNLVNSGTPLGGPEGAAQADANLLIVERMLDTADSEGFVTDDNFDDVFSGQTLEEELGSIVRSTPAGGQRILNIVRQVAAESAILVVKATDDG